MIELGARVRIISGANHEHDGATGIVETCHIDEYDGKVTVRLAKAQGNIKCVRLPAGHLEKIESLKAHVSGYEVGVLCPGDYAAPNWVRTSA